MDRRQTSTTMHSMEFTILELVIQYVALNSRGRVWPSRHGLEGTEAYFGEPATMACKHGGRSVFHLGDLVLLLTKLYKVVQSFLFLLDYIYTQK